MSLIARDCWWCGGDAKRDAEIASLRAQVETLTRERDAACVCLVEDGLGPAEDVAWCPVHHGRAALIRHLVELGVAKRQAEHERDESERRRALALESRDKRLIEASDAVARAVAAERERDEALQLAEAETKVAEVCAHVKPVPDRCVPCRITVAEAKLAALVAALEFVCRECSVAYCLECGMLTFFEKDGVQQHEPECPLLEAHKPEGGQGT